VKPCEDDYRIKLNSRIRVVGPERKEELNHAAERRGIQLNHERGKKKR